MFANIIRPFFQRQINLVSSIGGSNANLISFNAQQQSRNLSKTHRATYKRWRKTADGYKRGIQGRKHGNAGYSNRVLSKRTGIAYSTPQQAKQLKRLMPYA